jgi:hypothetical protein
MADESIVRLIGNVFSIDPYQLTLKGGIVCLHEDITDDERGGPSRVHCGEPIVQSRSSRFVVEVGVSS